MFTVSATGPEPVPTPAPLVITSPGTYRVAADGFDGTVTPVQIRSSDVVLDGGNHTLDGTGQVGSCGVLVAGNGALSNVTVRNLRLTNWETGIRVANAAGSAIEHCDVEHNRVGVVLDDTQGVEVWDNRVVANDGMGIGVANSTDAIIHANDVSRTGDGFYHLVAYTMDLGTFAVSIGGSDRTAITGNDLGGDYGSLDFAHSMETRVTGNQLTGKRVGILSIQLSEGGLVADNVFRNYNNLYSAPANASWNATPSPGPNIVGGPTIGGNFWAKPDGTGFSETHPDANRDGFIDTPYDNDWGGIDYLPLATRNGPAPGPTPYKALTGPGRIEAEDYDLGGEGIAYHDTTPGNSGGAYRQDDVDIETGNGITDVGWIRDGEYLTYTVNVTTAGNYAVTARVASPNSGRTIALSVDGTPATTITVPNTGSFDAYRDVSLTSSWVTATVTPAGTGGDYAQTPIALSAGTHTLKLGFHGDGLNLDRIELAPVTTPTPTPTPTSNGSAPYTPLAIPGTIQAEDYNLGGEGVAYHDTTAGNEGGAYRQDDVDIESGNGITNVGWIRSGEWLTYTATVQSAGTYTMTASVASPNSGRTIAVSVDGAPAVTIAVPNTGSFGTFRSVSVPVTLAAGSHTLRLTFAGDGQNLDWITFAATGTVTTTPTTPAPSGGASFTAAPVTAPHGTAVKFTVTPAAGKTISAAWWSFDATAHLNTWNSRTTNPTFYYPSAGTYTPLVKITYTDGSTETVQRAGYIRAT